MTKKEELAKRLGVGVGESVRLADDLRIWDAKLRGNIYEVIDVGIYTVKLDTPGNRSWFRISQLNLLSPLEQLAVIQDKNDGP